MKILAQNRCNLNYILTNQLNREREISTIPGQLSETVSAASWTVALDSFPVFTCFEIGDLPIPSSKGRAHHNWESFLRMVDGGNNVTGCRWVSFPTYSQVVVSLVDLSSSLIGTTGAQRQFSLSPSIPLSLFYSILHSHLSYPALSLSHFSLYLRHSICLLVPTR